MMIEVVSLLSDSDDDVIVVQEQAPVVSRKRTIRSLSNDSKRRASSPIVLVDEDETPKSSGRKRRRYPETIILESHASCSFPRIPADDVSEIECGCCYDTFKFQEMVSCNDGHLFCGGCVSKCAEIAAFGTGVASLVCMGSSTQCAASFPKDQLQRVLSRRTFEKLETRQAEESIALAKIPNLYHCPRDGCAFQAEVAGEASFEKQTMVFNCPLCKRRSCIICNREWDEDHIGKKCDEIQTDAEVAMRTRIESAMAEARIRECGSCKMRFTKQGGCNKMTCRCGAKMCYVCRQPIGKSIKNNGYAHYCQHPREPGRGCSKCQRCNLWSDADEDDKLAIKEAREATESAAAQENLGLYQSLKEKQHQEIGGDSAL